MEKKETKLLSYWVSPFGLRVEWALKLKGVEYEYIEEDIFNKSNNLLQMNPVHKAIPVLIHHNKPICESNIIMEYIDENWSQYPLMPQDPHQRAITRFWATFVEEKVFQCSHILILINEHFPLQFLISYYFFNCISYLLLPPVLNIIPR